MTDCYIFDIDGTIADNSHRTHHLRKQPKDWDAYHAEAMEDGVHEHIASLLWSLKYWAKIVFCTGRHDGQRQLTQDWFYKVGLPMPQHLYMRKQGDHRDDDIIKRELLDEIIRDGFKPIMVFDDRN